MTVSWLHPEYEANVSLWQRCRNVLAGSDAVKAGGKTYLPKPPAMREDDYQVYKTRALFYNATARTVDGLVGAIFRKPVQVEAPPAIEPFLVDITLQDEPLESFAKALLYEIFTVGRTGILVDVPQEAGPDSRPYLTNYCAEQIRNWRCVKVGDLTLLSLVVLFEEFPEVDAKDPFVSEMKGRYRVLQLKMEGPTRTYTQTIWNKVEENGKEKWVAGETFIPTSHGEPFDFIPFVFIGPNAVSPCVERSPILDLVDVNLSHYCSSADLEQARFFTGSPTPYVTGLNNPDAKLAIGSSQAWIISNENAKVGILSYGDGGPTVLERALAEKEAKMAALGARLLENQKVAQEAAETVRLRHSGENSVVQSIAQTCGMGLTKAMGWLAGWAGADPDSVSVKLNTDLMDINLSPQELTALMALWQGNAISKATLYSNLEKGELTRPGVSYEQEQQDINSAAVL